MPPVMIVDEIPTVVNNTVSDFQNETISLLTRPEPKTVSSTVVNSTQTQNNELLKVENRRQSGFLNRMFTIKTTKVQPVNFDGKEGEIIDDKTLRKKIDVLFEGQYTNNE